MSENLDLVRSIYEDWGRGDYSSAEWAHPEIEWVFADGPAPGRRTGIAAAGEAWHDFLTAWEDYRPEVDEYRELDDGCVLVLVQHVGRGKASLASSAFQPQASLAVRDSRPAPAGRSRRLPRLSRERRRTSP
jgi:hypothetical protein